MTADELPWPLTRAAVVGSVVLAGLGAISCNLFACPLDRMTPSDLEI